MNNLKGRYWDYNLQKMIYFDGIFNNKPYTETSNFVQYESCPKYHKISDVMLMTSFIDKWGKNIYENDFWSSSNDGKDGCDVWDNEVGIFLITWDDTSCEFKRLPDSDENSIFNLKYVEIVGNKFENPELVKENYFE